MYKTEGPSSIFLTTCFSQILSNNVAPLPPQGGVREESLFLILFIYFMIISIKLPRVFARASASGRDWGLKKLRGVETPRLKPKLTAASFRRDHEKYLCNHCLWRMLFCHCKQIGVFNFFF